MKITANNHSKRHVIQCVRCSIQIRLEQYIIARPKEIREFDWFRLHRGREKGRLCITYKDVLCD